MRPIYAALALSFLALGCGKLGVGSSSSGGSTSSAATTNVPLAPAAEPMPKIRITTPARGAFLATGRAAVEGEVIAVTTATADAVVSAVVNGLPVTLDAQGKFRAFADLTTGLNVIDAVVTDARRRQGSTVIGVQGGTYRPAGLPIPHAAVARINDASLDAIGKIAESALWATDWTALFQSLNPILDRSFLWMSVEVNINQIRFRDLHVTIDCTPQGLLTKVDLDAPIIDCTVGADLGLGVNIGPYAAVASADSGVVSGALSVAPGNGGVVISHIGNENVAFQNFNLSVNNGIIDAAVQLLAKRAIQNALTSYISNALTNKLCPFVDKNLAEVLQQQKPFDMLGKPFSLDIRAESITFDDHGVSFSLAYNSTANGGVAVGRAVHAPGSLVTAGAAPSTATNQGFLISVDDDAANRAFYSMWAGGVMDVTLDEAFVQAHAINLPIRLEAGSLRRFLPEIGGRVADSAPARVHLHADLPPTLKITGQPDVMVVQAGEIVLDVDVDRGNGFERLLTAVAQLQVGGNIGFTAQGLHVSALSQPSFRFDIVDEPIVELDNHRLQVLLSVVLQPLVPHLMNTSNVLWIPHLSELQSVNVTVHQDGASNEHLSVSGDLLR